MRAGEEDLFLSALAEIVALEDMHAIAERACERVVASGPYGLALLVLEFDGEPLVGLAGGDPALRARVLEYLRRTPPDRRAEERAALWSRFRVPGTNACLVPERSGAPFSAALSPGGDGPGGEGRPRDQLVLFLRGFTEKAHGLLVLDRLKESRRADPAAPGRIAAIEGFVTLVGVILHDKHLARRLRESEARYAAVVEQGHDGVLIERGGKVLFANRRLGEMLGADAASLVGRDVGAVFVGDRTHVLPGERVRRLRGPDGRTLEVAWKEATIRFGGEEASLHVLEDVSERERILKQILRAQKMESVGSLASGIAHDFNNLLVGILGYASLIEARLPDDHPLKGYVRSIEQAADRAASVTRQLLGVVRDEKVRVAPVVVPALLDEIARLLRDTLASHIDVDVRCARELPCVLGDDTQLHQVLLNVCLNARDAMPDGGTLRIEADVVEPRLPVRGRGRFVRIAVHDTGCGMDRATLDKVFDPFFTTKEVGKGTGLGLYMAYRIVERHGGTIDIESELGKGTAVEIYLPAAAPDAPSPRGSVLLVDDEELIREVAAEMLGSLSIPALLAESGERAVEIVREGGDGLRCVVLDVALPGIDGWEAARRIRALAPGLPIVVSTGNDMRPPPHVAAMRDLVFLKKPYRIGDLRAAIEKAAPVPAA
jgi:two-component system cell cycle sensor histidine kinase/response regulator CckA